MNQGKGDGGDMTAFDMERLSAIYAHTPRDEPPPALDASILGRSRAALGAGGVAPTHPQDSGPAGAPGGAANDRRWMKPLATAALVFVTASLVVLMDQRSEERGDAEVAVRSVQSAPASAPSSSQASAVARAPASNGSDTIAQTGNREAASESNVAASSEASGARMDFLAQRTPEALPARSREAERPAPAEVRERRMAMARDVETPETVLARILEFRKAGRMKEAEELLQVFKKQYPAFELPAELREPSPTRPND